MIEVKKMHIHKFPFFKYSLLIFSVLFSAQSWAGEDLIKGAKWSVVGDIDIPPGKAGIFYQNGKPVAAISGDQYSPWCQLVFKDASQEPRKIVKGHYVITKITYDDDAINPTQISYKTMMQLKPADSSDIASLAQIICGHWDDNTGSYLTVKEIRQALDGVMRLELSSAKG